MEKALAGWHSLVDDDEDDVIGHGNTQQRDALNK